ncbi:DHA1 family bicyclomycin/chloramphenicol resistance-like MFS transporter [Chitinophaga skermanii]|uniref:DHA1 family bicyclomycin/chloramphenicol resistance-like MFS transporter n=1 Tax=Chitinophaga skermanii TaxID=331697 RepID=A0A327R3Y2_9BACT|nr:multidrug effflux MFS transporter [Chitinophaga skermanii]RAJ08587.1 DHA1 family bicyclomycin/chloramphenicol resistance-like MFS transporter [Chitinophaga skermanii]
MTHSSNASGKFVSLILILGSLTALGPFTIDMYLPGFPAIAKDLQTDANHVALSLSSYFIGISAGQLLYGPLLDRFGRKLPLYIGLAVYIISSLACAYVHTIDGLIAWRFFQAIGSCAATVAAMAMVRDLFPVEESAKVFALLLLVVGASPLLAPTIGGYVTAAFGWHSVFLILTGLGILTTIACILWLPTKYQPDKNISLKPGPILRTFGQVLSQAQFYTYAFTGAIVFSGLFAYLSASPKLFMEVYAVSEQAYGWIFAVLAAGFIGSSQFNTLLLRKFSSEQLIRFALPLQALISITFFAAAYFDVLNLTLVLIFIMLWNCCLGIINPNAAALTLAPFEKNAGSASALMGAAQMGIGALSSVFVSLLSANSAMPLATAFCGASVLGLLVLMIGRRNIKHPIKAATGTTMAAH